MTHAHGDHMGGLPSFPDAEVYAIEPDAKAIRGGRSRTVQGLADGDVVKAFRHVGRGIRDTGPHTGQRRLPGVRRSVPGGQRCCGV